VLCWWWDTFHRGHIFAQNAKVVHKKKEKMWNKFSIQIAESLILHSNTVFKHPDLVVRLVCIFSHTCVFVRVHVHQCTHAHDWHHARIFVCSYSVSIINSRKLIQFIAFTYWPEPLLQGGIMADWVCTKTGEEKKRESRRRRGRRKENGNMPVRKHIRVTRWGLFT